jgi:cation diffusion facilitator family transporter
MHNKHMSKDCCVADKIDLTKEQNKSLKKVFWIVLIINLVMFFTEAIGGYVAKSNALWADSLDMLADVFIYGLSLYVLTRGHQARVKASLAKGWLMAGLGLFVVGEAIYKIVNPVLPTAEAISVIGGIAFVANLICLLLLLRHKDTDLNTKSAWICSRNDVFANVSVVVAGILVGYFNSMWPDILVGLGIAFIVLRSSIGIIKEALKHRVGDSH